MSLSITCPTCGHSVRYTEEDRGAELYCSGCQRAVLIPVEDTPVPADASETNAARAVVAPNPPPVAMAGVFSSRGIAEIDDRVLEQVECSCGAKNEARLADLGGSIYCGSCGLEIPVRHGWNSTPEPRGGVPVGATAQLRPTVEPLAPRSSAAAPPRGRDAMSHGPWRLAAVVAALLAGGLLWWRSRSPQPDLPRTFTAVDELEIPQLAPLAPATAAQPFNPDELTLEMVESLRDMSDPFQAIVQAVGWDRALRKSDVPADDPRRLRCLPVANEILRNKHAALIALAKSLVDSPRPDEAIQRVWMWTQATRVLVVPADDPLSRALADSARGLLEIVEPITLEMIDGLRSGSPLEDGLVQAALWREDLQDRSAAESDPRFQRLDEVVAAIQRQLRARATPASPAEVKTFQETVQRLADALGAGNYAAAVEAAKVAEELLRLHPESLASHAIRLQSLKGKLRYLENREQGLAQVRQHVSQAESLLVEAERMAATDGKGAVQKVSQALLQAARGKMKVFQGRWRGGETEEFEQRFGSLQPKLQYGRGWRAVVNAKRAHEAADIATRKREADRAFALLQGLPEDTIRPWLDQVRAWHAEPSPPRPGENVSDLGKEIELWNRLESFFEHFATVDLARLGPECAALWSDVERAPVLKDLFRQRIGDLFYEAIDSKYSGILASSGTARDGVVADGLREIGQSLAQAGPWREEPRFVALRAMVREQTAPLARAELARAGELAKEGQLAEAVNIAELIAATAADEVADEANRLVAAWKREIDLRADQRVQEDDWRRVTAARKTGESESLAALESHLRRWPRGTHAEEATRLREQLVAKLRLRFRTDYAVFERAHREKNWPKIATMAPGLMAAAPGELERKAVETIQGELERLRASAQKELTGLGAKRDLKKPEDILAVRVAALKVLSVSPDDAVARDLWEKSKEQADKLARRLLKSSRLKLFLPERTEADLRTVLRLAPGPELEDEAKRLLAEL